MSFSRLRLVVDPVRTVDLRGDRLDLLPERRAVGVRNGNEFGLLARRDDGLGELVGAGAALREALFTTTVSAPAPTASSSDQLDLLLGVGREAVDRRRRTAARTSGRSRCGRPGCRSPLRRASRSSFAELIERHPAVGLRRAHGGDEHRGAGREPARCGTRCRRTSGSRGQTRTPPR